MIPLIVTGATGRVGARVCALACSSAEFELVGAYSSGGGCDPATAGCDVRINAPATRAARVIVDFSTDAGARRALSLALDHNAAALIATTGLSDDTMRAARDAAARLPVMLAPNTSLGATLLASLSASASRVMSNGYDISIIEAHRKGKRDAPSGTALHLARAVRETGGRLDDDQILSIRAGDTVGEHTVRFCAGGETVELTHRVSTRDVFASGALRAARWLAERAAPGWRSMEEVMGLSPS